MPSAQLFTTDASSIRDAATLQKHLQSLATDVGHKLSTLEFATAVDQRDSLREFRQGFNIPPHHQPTDIQNDTTGKVVVNEEKANGAAAHSSSSSSSDSTSVYLCGNSLGLQPKRTQQAIAEEMQKWALAGVEGHFTGERPWAKIDERSTALTVDLVGAADSDEIAIANTLSVNLHLLLLAFYQPPMGPHHIQNTHSNSSKPQGRYKILMEEQAFCSDWHVLSSQVQFHGYTVDEALIRLQPRKGESYIRTEDILETIEQHKDTLAMVMLPGVQFYSGQLFDMPTITAAGHKAGAIVGFDLAHTAGNVPLQLHEWQVDFAAWCTYKYLNAGPGAIGGLFVHNKHKHATTAGLQHEQKQQEEGYAPSVLRRLSGWWGQDASVRFQMKSTHQPKLGAQSFMLSNPPVLPTVCLETSLQIFEEADIRRLRNKSLVLTGYLEHLLQSELRTTDVNGKIKQLTPTDPLQRGAQLSLFFEIDDISPVAKALLAEGVVIDERRPNVIRVSPAPLYNSFTDVYKAVQAMKRVLQQHKLL